MQIHNCAAQDNDSSHTINKESSFARGRFLANICKMVIDLEC